MKTNKLTLEQAHKQIAGKSVLGMDDVDAMKVVYNSLPKNTLVVTNVSDVPVALPSPWFRCKVLQPGEVLTKMSVCDPRHLLRSLVADGSVTVVWVDK